MSDDLDPKITRLLAGWEAPPPSQMAISQILARAQEMPRSTRQSLAWFASVWSAMYRRRTLLVLGPAVAAALWVAIVTPYLDHRLPVNDPILQQDALSTFDMRAPGPEAEEEPAG